MTEPVWLEVALNGPWSRARQPGIPITVDAIVAEGVACAEAGAAIVHVHPYDEATGRQKDDAEIYARIIEGIRSRVDAIVYPTIPFAGTPDMLTTGAARERYAAVDALAARGLLEWAVVDPGSTNIALLDDVAAQRDGFVYLNPESHIQAGLDLAARYGFHASFAIYEPGFARLGAAMARRTQGLPAPIYRLMFSDAFSFGLPPTDWALAMYRRLLGSVAPGAPWMVAGLGVGIAPLIADTVAAGGHVRVGLEDAPLGSTDTNLALVEDAARAVARAGARLATPAEIRRRLKETP